MTRVTNRITGTLGTAAQPHTVGWVTVEWDNGTTAEYWAPLTAGWLVIA